MLIGKALNAAVIEVVNELESRILSSAFPHGFKLQRGLQRLIETLPAIARKLVPILKNAANEELCMVVTCDGETRKRLHQGLMKPAAIALFKSLCGRGRRIIIKCCGDIRIIFAEMRKIIRGIHEPLGVAKQTHHPTGIQLLETL